MKKFIFTLLALGCAFWLASMHPRFGLAVYDVTAATEAKLYGFNKVWVELDEMPMATYQRGAPTGDNTVILLHGYTASKELWLRFAKHLGDDIHVVIPDLAGHGETGYFSGWSYTASAQAERVKQLMNELGVQQAHMVGNSMGGLIAANFAIMYPMHTQSIALFNPAGISPPTPSVTEAMFAQGNSPFEVNNTAEFLAFYRLTMAQPPFAPEFVLRGMAERYMQRKQAYQHIANDFRFNDQLDNRLGLIKIPTLIVWGDKDQILSPTAAPVWHDGIAGSKLVVFEGIGHMPMVEVPDASAALVSEFVF